MRIWIDVGVLITDFIGLKIYWTLITFIARENIYDNITCEQYLLPIELP
jgi:hypothetical protein